MILPLPKKNVERHRQSAYTNGDIKMRRAGSLERGGGYGPRPIWNIPMSRSGRRIIQGAREALAIIQGDAAALPNVPLSDFEALQDALDAAHFKRAMADIANGVEELLTADEVRAALAAASPLAFWRDKRGLTQATLAAAAGISQSCLAGLEAGSRKGDPALFLRLARALAVRIEDIVPDDGAREP